MNFTFGIITDNSEQAINVYLPRTIKSIHDLNIPSFEIILVGNKNLLTQNFNNCNIIDFNDTIKPKWITKKKNLITKHAKYENIVYQHDYVYYDSDWYVGYKKFGDNFTICMNKIKNADGTRFRDWLLFPYFHAYQTSNSYGRKSKNLWAYTGIANNECMLPYDENRLIKYQYISGSYWVAKKHIMLEIPLDENLVWGQGEDARWSMKILDRYNFSMNSFSTVHFSKQKQDAFGPIRHDCLIKAVDFVTRKG